MPLFVLRFWVMMILLLVLCVFCFVLLVHTKQERNTVPLFVAQRIESSFDSFKINKEK